MVGVVLYVLVDVILQMLPPHYSAISDAESNLAVGPFGWVMNLNFLGRGVTTVCALVAVSGTGLRTSARDAGTVLLMIGGASSALLAILPTDVADASGAVTPTAGGIAHLWVAGSGFIAALSGVLVLTVWVRNSRGLRRAHVPAVVLASVATGGLLALGASYGAAPAYLGLAERICLAAILGWTFVVCAAIRRQSPGEPAVVSARGASGVPAGRSPGSPG
jgi:hypothetical protein